MDGINLALLVNCISQVVDQRLLSDPVLRQDLCHPAAGHNSAVPRFHESDQSMRSPPNRFSCSSTRLNVLDARNSA